MPSHIPVPREFSVYTGFTKPIAQDLRLDRQLVALRERARAATLLLHLLERLVELLTLAAVDLRRAHDLAHRRADALLLRVNRKVYDRV